MDFRERDFVEMRSLESKLCPAVRAARIKNKAVVLKVRSHCKDLIVKFENGEEFYVLASEIRMWR